MINPLVSVIIPTYNKAEFISKTVYSVLHQTYRNFEIILVDNGSTDDTLEMINSQFTTVPSLRVIKTLVNLGPSGARNTGMKEARGEYIFFLDGDDLIFPEKIETQVALMEKHKDIGLTLTSYLISDARGALPRLISFSDIDSLVDGWLSMRGFGGLIESTGCIRTTFLNEDLYYDESLMGSEGLDLTKRWRDSHKCMIIADPLTFYRTSESQLHLNTAAIRENMTRITNNYFANNNERKFNLESQEAFFYIDSLRTKKVLQIFLGIITRLNIKVFVMVFCLIKRNFLAYSKGFRFTKRIKRLLETQP